MKNLAGLIFLSVILTPAFSQHINTDAITRFWRVVERLEQDHPLDDSLWDYYYNHPGNRDYMQKNRPPEQVGEHRKYLEFVFRPSLRDSLRAMEQADAARFDDIAENLLYIKVHEKELRSYTGQVASPAYLQLCIQLAKQYLPKGKWKPVPNNLTVYVMAMAFDAAVQDTSMYFGLARVYEYDRYRKGALAGHEMHHQQRENKEIRHAVSSADSASFSAIDEINNEGSADLIDKMLLLDNPGKVFRGVNTVHRLVDRAPATIHKLDSCFLVNARGGVVMLFQLDQIMAYSSGHLPGMYMTDVIRRNGFERRLIEHNDNPFQFFYLYNEAAARDSLKPPVFTPETIAYLHGLEQRCF